MRAAVLMSMQLAACGRWNFDPVATVDAAGADTAADAVPVGTGPWGAPVRLFAGFGPFDDASQTADGLALFVNADTDLLSSTRQRTSDPWSEPVPLPEFVGVSGTQPFVRSDGLELYYSGFSPGTMQVSRRANRTAAWGAPVSASDVDVFVAYDLAQRTDGLEGLMSAGSPAALSLVRRSSLTAPWQQHDALVAPNAGLNNSEGCLAEYGLALYFGSTRGGGILDLYRAERISLEDPFGPALPIGELNTGSEESDPWVSEDGHTLYFTSDRDGERQIWMATR